MTLVTSILALVLALGASPAAPGGAPSQTDAERAAALVVRWQQIVYPAFESARAFIAEEESDTVNAFLSGGAVRAIRDHLDAAGLRKADEAIARFAAAMVKAGTRRPDGSTVLEADAYEKALDATCPLYPFCDH